MPPTDEWTVGRLLQWTADYLGRHNADSPRLDAEVLLAEALNCRRIELYTTLDDIPPEHTRTAFRELVPLDYSGMRLAGDDPESIRGSWDELQKAESSLLAALREYPANIFLNEKLMDLRSQQLQFVKQMVLLEQNNWRRT